MSSSSGTDLSDLIKYANIAADVIKEICYFLPDLRKLANKLIDSVEETKRDLAKAKQSYRCSWDAVFSAVDSAITFVSAVEQFASWGCSGNRIAEVKEALDYGNFQPFLSLVETLNILLECTERKVCIFREKFEKAQNDVPKIVQQNELTVQKTKHRETQWGMGGGITSALCLAGAITGGVLTLVCPPAGASLVVGAIVASGAAGKAGVATAVNTGITRANIASDIKGLVKVGKLIEIATSVSVSVAKTIRQLDRAKSTMLVVYNAHQYAQRGYYQDVVDSVESLRKEADDLYMAARFAENDLKKLLEKLKSCMNV